MQTFGTEKGIFRPRTRTSKIQIFERQTEVITGWNDLIDRSVESQESRIEFRTGFDVLL
jgi:O-phosphoseryl-tRNA(Cys) synthetase